MSDLNFSMSVLKEDEKILASLNCNLKSFIDLNIVDKDGVLLITDDRILFCEYIKSHLSVVHNFEYKLITSFKLIEDEDTSKHINFKYNGDKVKITKLSPEDATKAYDIFSKIKSSDLV